MCCPVWLPTPIGTLDEKPEDIWNGAVAKDVRASIIDGSFRHCNHLHCQVITNRKLPSRESPEAQAYIKAYASPTPPSLPSNVHLSHDKSCNLSCPSCRGGLYLANKSKQAKLDQLAERFVLPLLKNAKLAMITGSGDPFASNHFRNVIKRLTPSDYPELRFNLITNGQLCDEKGWTDLNLGSRVDNLHISVDATTSETYSFVRRLGNFDRLRKNLAFVKGLRDRGDVGSLDFSMVVQSMNFREMPALVELGKEFSADTVHFEMIRKRDIFSADEFDAAFIGNPNHPDYADFLEVISSDALQNPNDRPRIEMGNVLTYVGRQKAQAAAA